MANDKSYESYKAAERSIKKIMFISGIYVVICLL